MADPNLLCNLVLMLESTWIFISYCCYRDIMASAVPKVVVPKAMWLLENHKIWVELYVEHIKKYGLLGGGINKEGHNQVAEAFNKRT